MVQGTGYIVSSLGYIAHGFKITRYLVSIVRGTWFWGYEVGVHSFSLPPTRLLIYYTPETCISVLQ